MSAVVRSVVAMEIVEISVKAAGEPVSFVREGRTWHIGTPPVRWFERVPWWETAQRMPRHTGRMDVEVWQVQARIGHNPRSPLVTFELVNGEDRETWSIRSMEAIAA